MTADEDRKLSNRIEETLYGMVGTSDCHKVGIWGGCGLDCWVYQEGCCPEPDEIVLETEEDRAEHRRLYGPRLRLSGFSRSEARSKPNSKEHKP